MDSFGADNMLEKLYLSYNEWAYYFAYSTVNNWVLNQDSIPS